MVRRHVQAPRSKRHDHRAVSCGSRSVIWSTVMLLELEAKVWLRPRELALMSSREIKLTIMCPPEACLESNHLKRLPEVPPEINVQSVGKPLAKLINLEHLKEKYITWKKEEDLRIVAKSFKSTAMNSDSASSTLPLCPSDLTIKWDKCQGTIVHPDGREYVGEFRNDLRHGRGRLSNSDGGKYVGEFGQDKLNGQGVYTWSDGRRFVGEFKDGWNVKGVMTWPSGMVYSGAYKEGIPDGHGILTRSDGIKYNGNFKDGTRHGLGSETYVSNGDYPERYIGKWKDNQKHGQGTYFWPDGSKYVGEWKGNRRHGRGTFTAANGSRWTGSWIDGKTHGENTYSSPETEKPQFNLWDTMVASFWEVGPILLQQTLYNASMGSPHDALQEQVDKNRRAISSSNAKAAHAARNKSRAARREAGLGW